MPLTREQKQKIADDLKEKITRQKAMVFAAIEGLKSGELFELRKELKEKDCLITIVKKTLADRAFKENKIDCDIKKMAGQLALIFGFKDELLPAKISYKFSQSSGKRGKKLKILGGYFENSFVNAEVVADLAKIPSKEELLTRLVVGIKAPVANFVNVLRAPLKSYISVIRSLGESKAGK